MIKNGTGQPAAMDFSGAEIATLNCGTVTNSYYQSVVTNNNNSCASAISSDASNLPADTTMKQHIYFVRYGLTKYPLVENEGPYDSPLHPIDGYEHGIAIARRLAGMSNPPEVVYSSSLHRAVSTSQLIVHALGRTKNSIRIEDGLIEWLTPSLTIEPDGTRLNPRSVQQLVDMTFTGCVKLTSSVVIPVRHT